MRAQHYDQLGAVRGIAALAVCMGHVSLVYDLPENFRLAWDVPVNPHGAVVLFFVLSGFVLGLSWQRFGSGIAAYARFLIRRAFRIAPALWLATAAAIAGLAWLPMPADAPVSDWYQLYSHPLTTRAAILAFLVMDNDALPPVWTIYIEICGSFAIPLLVWLFQRGRIVAALVIAGLLLLVFPTARLNAIAWPLAYMVDFAAGVALALWPPRLSRGKAGLAIALGVLLLTLGRALWFRTATGAWQDGNFDFASPAAALVELAGSILLIAGLVSGTVRARLLEWTPLRLLGDWSYSLYLIHFAVMRALAAVLAPLPPFTAFSVLLAGTVALSLLLSAAIYRWIELPGIALGKRLTARTP